MQVYAQTDESDVGNIHLGQEATFNVDAFPGQTFKGRVSQIRMNATIVQNVVTYNTIVDFDNPQEKLFPGMTAYVTIPVADATNAVKIPNGALRYKPDLKPEEIRALLKKAGIGGNGGGAADGATGGTESANAQRPRSTPGGGTDESGAMRAPAAGAGHGPRMDVAVVWKLTPNKTIDPVQVRTGITDHTYTAALQVLHGSLEPGDELVTGSAAAKSAGGPPGMGGGPRR
jgi:HlyD family secretion protein